MAKTLAALVTQLQGYVSASGGIPTSAQYEQAIKDAVSNFNDRVGFKRRASLSIVANTATYALPTDFLKMIELVTLPSNGMVTIIGSNLMLGSPGQSGLKEEWEIVNKQITFYPTPCYTGTRYLWYKAGHVLDESDTYANMDDADASLIMLKARALSLRLKADQASAGLTYRFGDVSVQKQVTGDQTKATNLEKDYNDAIEKRIGVIGSRSEYRAEDVAAFIDEYF